MIEEKLLVLKEINLSRKDRRKLMTHEIVLRAIDMMRFNFCPDADALNKEKRHVDPLSPDAVNWGIVGAIHRAAHDAIHSRNISEPLFIYEHQQYVRNIVFNIIDTLIKEVKKIYLDKRVTLRNVHMDAESNIVNLATILGQYRRLIDGETFTNEDGEVFCYIRKQDYYEYSRYCEGFWYTRRSSGFEQWRKNMTSNEQFWFNYQNARKWTYEGITHNPINELKY